MKRLSQAVAGGPRNRPVKSAVAGRPAQSRVADVASILASPTSTPTTEEADLLADFADFMSEEEELEPGLLPTPDAMFKERLRRRLWRTFVLSDLRGGGETPN